MRSDCRQPSEECDAFQSLFRYQISCNEQLGEPMGYLHLLSAGSQEDGEPQCLS